MSKKRVLKLLQMAGKAVLMGVASGVGKAIGLFLLAQLLR
jgi:hypothetical protein